MVQDSHFKFIRQLWLSEKCSKFVLSNARFILFYAEMLRSLRFPIWNLNHEIHNEVRRETLRCQIIPSEYEYNKNPKREWYWNIDKHLITLNHLSYSKYLIRRQIQGIYNDCRERKGEARCNDKAAKNHLNSRNCQNNWRIKLNFQNSQLF